MIRKTTLWALRALLYLADQQPGHLALASEVAGAVGAPAGTMTKVMQRLALAGLVVSQRGVGGGYLLAQPAASVSVLQVLRAMDDPLVADGPDADSAGRFARLGALLAGLQSHAIERLGSLAIADLGAAPGN